MPKLNYNPKSISDNTTISYTKDEIKDIKLNELNKILTKLNDAYVFIHYVNGFKINAKDTKTIALMIRKTRDLIEEAKK